jgi:hypothetical protein
MNVNLAYIVPAGVPIAKNSDKPLVSPKIGVQASMYFYPMSFFESAYELCLFQGRRMGNEIDDLLEELYGNMELPNASFLIRMDNGL